MEDFRENTGRISDYRVPNILKTVTGGMYTERICLVANGKTVNT